MGDQGKESAGGKKFVLVVNPDRETNEAICEALDEAGYEVMAVEQGEVGFETARRQKPDLILINIDLPDTDGAELCRRIGADGETRGIPIVMISERKDPAEKILAFESGARRFISKPFGKQELVAEVEKTLEQLDRTRQIDEYHKSCETDSDFGVFPTDLKEQTEKCEKDKKRD